MLETITNILAHNGLITAFVIIGITMWIAYFISK